MKLIHFQAGEQIRLGIKTEKGVIDVEQAAQTFSLVFANENGTRY